MKALAVLLIAATAVLLGCSRHAAPRPAPTPVSPSAFATAFNPNPATPTLPTVTAALTADARVAGPGQIVGLSFVSASNGWILRSGAEILHTEDGGRSWATQYRNAYLIPSSIQFVDPQHGWVAGSTGGPYCLQGVDRRACTGAVLRTSDGGATWRMTNPSPRPITAIHFVGHGTGWAVSARGRSPITVLRTTDGGATWASMQLAPQEISASARLAVIDATAAIVVAGDATYMTSDGGLTWRTAPSPCTQKTAAFAAPRLVRVTMLDARTGWAICADGAGGGMLGSLLFQTLDGGSVWTLISAFATSPREPLPGVGTFPGGDGEMQFFDAQHGLYVTGEVGSFVCSTFDAGHNWRCAQTGLGLDNIFLVRFVDRVHGFVAAYPDGFARTTDGGAHWQELPLPK